MDKKIIQFHVCIDGCHIPMKMMPRSTGYDFWPSCDITLRTKTITRVATGVKVIIPISYIGVINSKSGLAVYFCGPTYRLKEEIGALVKQPSSFGHN